MMDKQCIFKTTDGQMCPNKAEKGLFCAEHANAQASEKPAAKTDRPSGGGGGGGSGWGIMGRTGVVYQKKD